MGCEQVIVYGVVLLMGVGLGLIAGAAIWG